jgi:hypothetical protein
VSRARVILQPVRYCIDAWPSARSKFRAKAGRDSPLRDASSGTVQGRYGILEDLDRGLDIASAAVATVPAGHAVQVTYLANLASKQLIRFRRTGLEPDLDDAVSNAEEASALMQADDDLRYGITCSNLAIMLRTCYARRREADDLERAIAAGRLAIETLPGDHPRRAGALSELGLNLLNRFEITGSQADLNEATRIAGHAVAARATGSSQVESGKLWAALACAASDHPQAEVAWQEVFGQLPLLTDRSLARADQEHHLRAVTGIASGAAATALGLRDPQSAWLRLEQGRGVLLGQELRTPYLPQDLPS